MIAISIEKMPKILCGWRWLVVIASVLGNTIEVRSESQVDAEGIAFFEAKIRPVLVQRCYECHSRNADDIEGGLLLDTREGLRLGGDSGTAVAPGEPSKSLLIAAIRYDGLEMPPDSKLPDEDIANIERWIQMGAPDPRDGPAASDKPRIDLEKAREYWAFQSIANPELPGIENRAWPRNSIDYFVLAKLEQVDLDPAKEADRFDLIRRVTFDLSGLPPTLQEIDDFIRDTNPDAYERLVDRLLASPRYGERWGQHWLDVVRFAETEGFEYDRTVPGVWRYRDYVVQAFNEGIAYDDFLREQIAGDEIDANDPRLMVAAGFHRLGAVRRNAGNQEVSGSRNEVLTERADIIGSAVLGLTIGCARCHDHKFDPISQRDYYCMQAYFAASQEHEMTLVDKDEYDDWKKETSKIQKEIDRLTKELSAQGGEEEKATVAKIRTWEKELPPPIPLISTVHNEFENQTPIHVLKRGEWSMPGDRVSPNPPQVFQVSQSSGSSASESTPRTALAEWLADTQNPLTPRVIINRLWRYHFGQGIVKSPNDFGKNGQQPSHPELLDHLASKLLEQDWKMKPLHRMILLSSTYRQASTTSSDAIAQEIDPENSRLWKFNRRRLSAEEIRDSMLAISGELSLEIGGPSIMLPVDEQLRQQLYKPSQWTLTDEPREQSRRSIYLIAKRNLRLPFMEVFDQPTLQTSCASREESTHAPQALELLNGTISNSLADVFAARLERESIGDIEKQIDIAFRLATGRPPTLDEKRLALRFLQNGAHREFALAMFNLNAFLYVR
ncbi:MAG: PSD1 and planctomycete cytochrome C domain-containing protein [Pirellulaceae bacterium]|nr:PSD1 and planctomycete cytochrome C domain-containing protein [Pirellulaceae bacterium]